MQLLVIQETLSDLNALAKIAPMHLACSNGGSVRVRHLRRGSLHASVHVHARSVIEALYEYTLPMIWHHLDRFRCLLSRCSPDAFDPPKTIHLPSSLEFSFGFRAYIGTVPRELECNAARPAPGFATCGGEI